MIFDIDDFKAINDTFGHAVGDDALRRVTEIASGLIRPIDSFARLGGEEFALLLPETQQLDALLVADRAARRDRAPGGDSRPAGHAVAAAWPPARRTR